MLDGTEDDIQTGGEPSKRAAPERSTIAFPYTHLEDAAGVARAVYEKGAPLSRDQVAGVLGMAPTSGGFSLKINAARMFGLIDNQEGKYAISHLGERILSSDETESRAARREAFLKVELYQKAVETYRNRILPARPQGLENAFVSFGVPPKQKDKARLAFERSALFAGFFHAGKERLVEPIISGSTNGNRTGNDYAPETADVITTKTVQPADHRLIRGMLDLLPDLESGWSLPERARWLKALAVNLAMIYGKEGESDVTVEIPTVKSPATTHGRKAQAPREESDDEEL